VIAKELQKLLSQPAERIQILPWWVGPSTLERVLRAREEIRGSVCSLSDGRRPFRESLARIGFAAAGSNATN
jgi:hypothetical protein